MPLSFLEVPMVTWTDLFAFCLVVIAAISLALELSRRRKE